MIKLKNIVSDYIEELKISIEDIPSSHIDEFTEAVKAGKNRKELVRILENPILNAIDETKKRMLVEIDKS